MKSIEEALSGADCAIFLVDHDLYRGISLEKVKGLMASPVVVDGKNLFTGGEGIVYRGIGKGNIRACRISSIILNILLKD